MELLYYLVGTFLGGIGFGLIFLTQFDNLTRTHGYVTIVAVGAFLANAVATSGVIGTPDVFTLKSAIGIVAVTLIFSWFILWGYFGRRLGLYLMKKRRFRTKV